MVRRDGIVELSGGYLWGVWIPSSIGVGTEHAVMMVLLARTVLVKVPFVCLFFGKVQ